MSDIKDTPCKIGSEIGEKFRSKKKISDVELPGASKMINEAKARMEAAIGDGSAKIKEMEKAYRIKRESFDVTLSSKFRGSGADNPIHRVIEDTLDIFFALGYKLEDISEFVREDEMISGSSEAGEPFRTEDSHLLRTQLTEGLISKIKGRTPPYKVICEGRVFRPEDKDLLHSQMFHRIEGIVIDKGITMGDLIGTIKIYVREFFGEEAEIRLRPHDFPFTQPSVEVDVTCRSCKGSGCEMCGGEGMIEVLAGGMIRPKYVESLGSSDDDLTGFAFGIGVERVAMARYGIGDISLFYDNDIRFLKQFK